MTFSLANQSHDRLSGHCICDFRSAAIALTLRANISETFLTAQNREQGEKEMNHDRRPEVWFGGDGITGPGSNTEGEAADFQCAL